MWPAIHFFHLPYAYLGYLGASLAIAGLAVLIFFAPFPRLLRYLIASSFFFVYQYAVIARPYVLMPLLGFGAAYFYRKGLSRIIPFSICIALLMQVSSYAAVIAIALAAASALQIASTWKEISAEGRRRVIAAGTLVAISFGMLIVVLFPNSDASLVAEAAHHTLEQHLQLVLEGLTGALADSGFIAIPLLFIAGLWAYERGGLLIMILSVGGAALVYGFLRGYPHHQGLITIAFVVTLWALWPISAQLDGLPRDSRRLHQGVLAILVVMFAWHCTWSYSAIRRDWAGSYSGARDAAMFLKSVHADQVGVRGYSYWAVGVQPYFDHNIFANVGGPDSPAARHFSFEGARRTDFIDPLEIQSGPPFVLISTETSLEAVAPAIERFWSWNYRLVYSSDGTRFFKNTQGVHALYLIFARTDWVVAQSNLAWNRSAVEPTQ